MSGCSISMGVVHYRCGCAGCTDVGVVVVGSVSPGVTLTLSTIQLNLVQMEREMRLKELEQLIKEATLVRYTHTGGGVDGSLCPGD